MKKFITKNKTNLLLISLVLCLVVEMLNRAFLYKSFSILPYWERHAVGYFIGVGAELAIFSCILAGSRGAGRSFAALSFLIGVLYYNRFTRIEDIDFWTDYNFITSVIMQFSNSLLVLFLSEKYVDRIVIDEKILCLRELDEQIDHKRMAYDKILDKEIEAEENYKWLISTHKENISNVEQAIAELKQVEEACQQNIAELKHTEATLQGEIVTLKARKNGMQKGMREEA